MKNFESKIEGNWNEVNDSNLLVDESRINQLNSIYNRVKLRLGEFSNYELISFLASEVKENCYIGILNCRVNGIHTQIRF